MLAKLTTLYLLLATASAAIPKLSGYSVIFSDDFNGAGTGGSNWDQVTPVPAPSLRQRQIYTEYESNAHLSGNGELMIVPKKRKGSTGATYWTSARLESKASWTCPPGKVMIFQSELRVPDFSSKSPKYDGMWPAFWAKGQSSRQGTKWPDCGEWDIFETTNKMGGRNQGTLHYARPNGDDNADHSGSVNFSGDYHTWALKIDRRDGDWKKQSLTMYKDGTQFFRITGAGINNQNDWRILAQSPYFVIFNFALGGDTNSYGGLATDNTVDGDEAAMRIKYFAVYQSN